MKNRTYFAAVVGNVDVVKLFILVFLLSIKQSLMLYRKLELSIIGIVYSLFTVAQTDGYLFNYMGMGAATALATDYQSIGVNPANLGYSTDYGIAIEIGGLGVSMFSESLTKSNLQQFMFNNAEELSDEQQLELATDLLNNGYRVDARVSALAMSFSMGNAGKIAVSANLRADQSFRLGSSASNLFFEGYDFENYFDTVITDDMGATYGVAYDPLSLSENTDGTSLNFSLQTAFNLSWGRQWLASDLVKLYGGIGARYVLSYAELDFKSEAGVVEGQAALGLDILNTPDYINTFDPNQEFLTPVGKGLGFDIGVAVDLGERLTAGLSVIDIGTVNYDLNSLAFTDVIVDTVRFDGVESTGVFDVIQSVLKGEEVIAYDGLESFSRPLPTTLRMGVAYRATDILTLVADFNAPLSATANDFFDPQLGLGAKLTLANVIDLSAGLTAGGGYGVNVPAGIAFNFPFWEIGVATRDITIFFGEESPMISYAIGILRFKI
jgi:hypothetical protein